MRRLIFGSGPIAQRLVFSGWHCQLEFKLADLWIGAFWKTSGHCFDLWVCLMPCLPIHFSAWWRDPQQ